MSFAIAVILAPTLLSGCVSYATSRYSPATDDVLALRSLNGKVLNVGVFTATTPGQNEIKCRGAPLKTPDGEPFSEYVRKALLDDLRVAGAYAPTAPITLTGNLDSIDFSSMKGNWNIALTVKSSNGRSISVYESFAYESSFFGERACNATAQALMPAVQDLIGKVVRSPEFGGLISP